MEHRSRSVAVALAALLAVLAVPLTAAVSRAEDAPAPAEKSEKQSAEKQSAEKQAAEKQAAEKQAAEKQAAEKQAAEKQAAEAQDGKKKDAPRKDAVVAHIKLSGGLDEAPIPTDALFGAVAENFRSKLDRIRKAQKDDAVHALVLELDGLNVGWGKIDELHRAIADFRKAGKKAYAYVETGEQKDYVIGMACDEIVVPEAGWLMLTGVRAGVSFYKDLFEKIGVKADILQMGDFKGAAEPFTRSEMSPQLRHELEKIVDDYYEKGLVRAILVHRGDRLGKDPTADQVKKLIDEGPYTPRAAKAAGLIDHVGGAGDLNDLLKASLKVTAVKLRREYARARMEDLDLSNPFAILKLLSPQARPLSLSPKIAVIYATGTIVAGKSTDSLMGGETCGSDTMTKAIRDADQDATVKAIVLRVDSPGGSALASDLMWSELKRCKKPVVVSMGDTAASGGYYISAAGKKIFAEPGTLTGSIGVVGGKLVLGGAFDKIGLKTQLISRGQNAGVLTSLAPFSPSEKKAMTALMKDVYEQFLEKVLQGRHAAGRKLDRADLEKLAGGRIWTGRQAKEVGLVDELGTLSDAIADAKKQAGFDPGAQMELQILPKTRSFLDQLIESRAESRSSAVRRAVRQHVAGLTAIPGIAAPLAGAQALLELQGEPVWALAPFYLDMN